MSSKRNISFGPDMDDALDEISTSFLVHSRYGVLASANVLREVYRRGARAHAAGDGMSREKAGMARVVAFCRLLTTGKPNNSAYVSDNDLLPVEHPRSTAKDAGLTASAVCETLSIEVPDTNEFDTAEDAVLTLTEYMGFGYRAEPAIRASWRRAVRNGEDPYRRARLLAELTYDSLDADLLPIRNRY